MKNIFFILIVLALTSLGCKNDLDINAPYKDIPVVYGFLDQNDTIQYIRIQKMYQNDAHTSTSAGAQITDSLYFDTLKVVLINIAKTPFDTFHCYRVDNIPKDNGFFSPARNTLYATKIPFNNNNNEVYSLRIFNPKSGKTYTSQATIIKDATIEFRNVAIRNTPVNHAFAFRFISSRNAYLHDLVIRYQYKEMSKADTSQFEIKNVDFHIAYNKTYVQSSSVSESISSRDYMAFLKTKISPDDSKVRRTYGIIYQVYGGSKDFSELLDLSKPSLGIVQKNPEYSNISEGLGIFTSRNFKQLNMGLDAGTLSLLASELPNFIN